jgi:hypothetical protein
MAKPINQAHKRGKREGMVKIIGCGGCEQLGCGA